MNKNKSSGVFLFSAGLLTLILGCYLILFESEKFATNMAILSIGLVLIGFLYIMSFVANKKLHFRPGWTLSQGFYLIVMGILILYTYNNELADSINLLFAMWALSTATAQIAASVKIRSLEYKKWWRILIFGLTNLAAFAYFIVDPFSSFLSLYTSLGSYLMFSGMICILEQFNYNVTIN